MRYDQINKRMLSPGRNLPVNLWRMDSPSLIEDEIISFNYDERLLLTLLSAFKFVCRDYCEKGFMITGFFGVGKSHFLKYVLFCLTPSYQQMAFLHLSKGLSQCVDGSLIESDLVLVQHEIELLPIETITIDSYQLCYHSKNLYYLIYKKIRDLKGSENNGKICDVEKDSEIDLERVCNELRTRLEGRPSSYRLIIFFDDLELGLGRDMPSIIQFLELLSIFHNEFAGMVRVFCSCQMGVDFNADYPELCRVLDSKMNRYHLSVWE